MIVEKVDGNAALINLDQSKAFDRVDHAFLEAVSSAAGFGLHFRTWICLLYASPRVRVAVNGVRSEPFTLTIDSSGLPVIAHVLYPCIRAVSAQDKGEPGPTQPHVTWRQWGSQEHCIRWRCQRACNEQCRGGGGEQSNRKLWQGPRLTAKSLSACSWARGKAVLIPAP